MTNPNDEFRDELAEQPTMTTGYQRGINQLEMLGTQPPATVGEEPYKKEPLFSKKVLFGWGLATLVVWFMVTTIVPAIVGAVKGAVRESVIESGDNAQTVIKTPNGTVTITKGPNGRITVDRNGRRILDKTGPVTTEPLEPLPPLEPAPPAPPAPAPTGKK